MRVGVVVVVAEERAPEHAERDRPRDDEERAHLARAHEQRHADRREDHREEAQIVREEAPDGGEVL